MFLKVKKKRNENYKYMDYRYTGNQKRKNVFGTGLIDGLAVRRNFLFSLSRKQSGGT